jgi:hypothetical protein
MTFRRRLYLASLAAVLVLMACGLGHEPEDAGSSDSLPTTATGDLDPNDSSILRRPFSAEQIRDEMVPGLRVLIRTTTPAGERVERWDVVSADEDGVEIEYTKVSGDGADDGEAGSQRSRWAELRDHATFPAERSTRERITLETALGTFEGWLYHVASEDGTRTDEFFFADRIPGAPVLMRTLEDGNEIFRIEQFARLRPERQ